MNWNWQLISFIAGPWAVILLIWLGISQLKKLTAFFIIMEEKPGWRDGPGWRERRRSFTAIPKDERETIPGRLDIPKHSEKVMLYSLIKYLLCLFVFTLLTFGVFIFPMIFIWGFVIFFSRRYIILWKAHKYSVMFLLFASLLSIVLSVFVSPFIRSFLSWLVLHVSRVIS